MRNYSNTGVCRSISSFSKDTSGAIAAFTVVCFLTMFVGVGMGVDFMRHEAQRAELQDALDRGVLAAAIVGGKNSQSVVEEFMQMSNYIDDAANVKVENSYDNGAVTVAASASYPLNTVFLKVIGMTELDVTAASAASQGVNNIEISLALDISGSMSREDTAVDLNTFNLTSGQNLTGSVKRLDYLKIAATDFIDTVLSDTNKANTSISLIPFAGQVNAGPTVMNRLASSRAHNHSSCIDFAEADFLDTDLPGAKSSAQTPHFQWFRFEADYGHNAAWGWCPSDDQSITYMTNNADVLKAKIKQFTAHDGTGTQNAMKWAFGLLDSRSQPMISDLAAAGEVPSDFADRPSAFGQSGAMKVIVLMSDGNTTEQTRPTASAYRNEQDISYWAANSLGRSESYTPGTSQSYLHTTRDAGRTQLTALCAQAKEKNVVVFTIGFDISQDSYAYEDLKACASRDTTFFNVNGVELSEAFESIAITISKLQLVY
jgi:hypothetical protein